MRPGPFTNRMAGFAIAAVFVGMVGMAYAAVPFYRMFCAATGFQGTIKTASAAPAKLGKHVMNVRFDANVAQGLDWSFAPEKSSISLLDGKVATVYYRMTNNSDHAITVTAVDNVQPDAAGAFADKIKCFCDEKHTLGAGKSVELPLVFYLDPALETSRRMAGVDSVTFSYTLYPAKGKGLNGS